MASIILLLISTSILLGVFIQTIADLLHWVKCFIVDDYTTRPDGIIPRMTWVHDDNPDSGVGWLYLILLLTIGSCGMLLRIWWIIWINYHNTAHHCNSMCEKSYNDLQTFSIAILTVCVSIGFLFFARFIYNKIVNGR